MPLTEHLRELRSRLIKSILALLVGTGASFYFASYIFEVLKEPIKRSYPKVQLITLSPTEPLFILIKISLVFGLILASPVVLYQIWRFVEPAMYPNEKKLILPITFFSIILFLLGGSFAYFAVLPIALKFLIGIGFSQLQATPFLSVNLYVSFLLKMIVGFGLAFEMPIVLYLLQRAGIVTEEQLKSFRKYFIVIAFTVGALIAPDVTTQVLMAIPLLLLYEISILLGKLTKKKSKTKAIEVAQE
ncbi:MAG: twin-arginine translocase subunit TatC [Hydrogenobacter thermophilus]|uniref:Sec-independent protein translocase protein TatC n=1 Tax=Hydrogenobacter thermophilus (strain DSM 6534 / IAM 12695 / TK-6) TaxID=608538 RepID=D3DGL7_HYDTT|nr:twin-arginine translocase subunit TatC [Hydrogenobacter thermophilus]ADO44904.1 Sec-independent protein translocase, TatC subunit [Hydrogenobacter thermophilus TK-6]QWK20693.1 MAG: twin-arginine translocase subunit TatC [Hydrogenobacter thermophilus]BAI68969.1 Sec-independent protein translocase TatC subunit [Hydrogenobacter thermophilus TK-6]